MEAGGWGGEAEPSELQPVSVGGGPGECSMCRGWWGLHPSLCSMLTNWRDLERERKQDHMGADKEYAGHLKYNVHASCSRPAL